MDNYNHPTPNSHSQDAASLSILGTDDFDLERLLETCTEVRSSSTLPVQSPSTLLASDSATPSAAFNTLQQPCVTLPSITFPSNTISLLTSSVSQASSHGQLVVGTGVNFNIRPPSAFQSLSVVSNTGTLTPASTTNKKLKPFTLKLRTKQIKICQSCRKDYEGENDTLGLVVAHLERKLITNPTTGIQFWGRESNSHYHANVMCLKKMCATFEIEVPKELIPELTILQKVYLMTCLQVPPMKLDLEV